MDTNIWSGSSDWLCASLTNPTEISKRKGKVKNDVGVYVGDRYFESAEQAYFTLRDGSKDLITMSKVICNKFRAHPELVEEVEKRGGIVWLQNCSHFTGAKTVRFQWWEGRGTASPFIATLVFGYALFKSGYVFTIPENPITLADFEREE